MQNVDVEEMARNNQVRTQIHENPYKHTLDFILSLNKQRWQNSQKQHVGFSNT